MNVRSVINRINLPLGIIPANEHKPSNSGCVKKIGCKYHNRVSIVCITAYLAATFDVPIGYIVSGSNTDIPESISVLRML